MFKLNEQDFCYFVKKIRILISNRIYLQLKNFTFLLLKNLKTFEFFSINLESRPDFKAHLFIFLIIMIN